MDESRLHQISTKMLPGTFIGYDLSSGGSWTGDLINADRHDIANYAASEVHVKRLESKVVGINKLQEVFKSPCAGGSLRHVHTHQRVERELRLGRVHSSLDEARGDSLQEEGGVADISEANRDAVRGTGFLESKWHIPRLTSTPPQAMVDLKSRACTHTLYVFLPTPLACRLCDRATQELSLETWLKTPASSM